MTRSNTIGTRIEELRKSKSLTQAELAKEMGVKRETVVQWESNTRDLKTAATVKLSDFFGVSCDYILRGINAENIDAFRDLGLNNRSVEALRTIKYWATAAIRGKVMLEILNGIVGKLHPLIRRATDYQTETYIHRAQQELADATDAPSGSNELIWKNANDRNEALKKRLAIEDKANQILREGRGTIYKLVPSADVLRIERARIERGVQEILSEALNVKTWSFGEDILLEWARQLVKESGDTNADT